MPLEKTFRECSTQLRMLHDRVHELRLAAVVDRPEKNDAKIVDAIEDAVEDLMGWVSECLLAAADAQRAVASPVDLDRARRALVTCQERLQNAERVFGTGLVSYERQKDLGSFGAERRGEWPSWVTSVKQGIEHCRKPLEAARLSLDECWQEMAERAGMNSISVQAIGNIVSGRPPRTARRGEESNQKS
jgi:exonuclease VII small subunit